MTFNNNVLVPYTFSGAGQITGTIGFTKSNTGSVTFNNVNAFTGLASIQNGSIVVDAAASLADTSYSIAAPGSLTVNGSLAAATITNAGTLTVGGTGSIDPTSTLSNSGSAAFSNPAQTLATVSGAGSLTLNGTALTISGTSTYGGAIGGSGSLLTGSAGTTLTLSAANSYGGGTTVIARQHAGPHEYDRFRYWHRHSDRRRHSIRGTGAVGGPIVVNAGGTLQPSGTGTWGSSVSLGGDTRRPDLAWLEPLALARRRSTTGRRSIMTSANRPPATPQTSPHSLRVELSP